MISTIHLFLFCNLIFDLHPPHVVSVECLQEQYFGHVWLFTIVMLHLGSSPPYASCIAHLLHQHLCHDPWWHIYSWSWFYHTDKVQCMYIYIYVYVVSSRSIEISTYLHKFTYLFLDIDNFAYLLTMHNLIMGKGTSIIRYNGLQPCCKLTKIDTILPTTVIQDDTANRRCDLSVSTIHRMFTVYPLVRTLGLPQLMGP